MHESLAPNISQKILQDELKVEKDAVIVDDTITAKVLKFDDRNVFQE